jgi:hypothetical protein
MWHLCAGESGPVQVFSDAGTHDANHALRRPASEKRQGTVVLEELHRLQQGDGHQQLADIADARRTYLSMFPTDPCAARNELAAISYEVGNVVDQAGVKAVMITLADEGATEKEIKAVARMLRTHLRQDAVAALIKALGGLPTPKAKRRIKKRAE